MVFSQAAIRVRAHKIADAGKFLLNQAYTCRYVQTSDGSRRDFRQGEVLFQDNTKDNPAAKPPQHASGTVGDQPCNLLISQVTFPPSFDKPCPFTSF